MSAEFNLNKLPEGFSFDCVSEDFEANAEDFSKLQEDVFNNLGVEKQHFVVKKDIGQICHVLKNHKVFTIRKNGKLVASAVLYLPNENNQDTHIECLDYLDFKLDEIAIVKTSLVDEQYREKGIMSALIAHADETAKKMGRSYMLNTVAYENYPSFGVFFHNHYIMYCVDLKVSKHRFAVMFKDLHHDVRYYGTDPAFGMLLQQATGNNQIMHAKQYSFVDVNCHKLVQLRLKHGFYPTNIVRTSEGASFCMQHMPKLSKPEFINDRADDLIVEKVA